VVRQTLEVQVLSLCVMLHANGGSGGNSTGTRGSDTIRVFTADGTFIA
jgi:hypothetical protein